MILGALFDDSGGYMFVAEEGGVYFVSFVIFIASLFCVCSSKTFGTKNV